MFSMTADVGPDWLSVDLVKTRLLQYLHLLQWSDDHTDIDLHFMVGVGDRLWNAVGSPPNLGREQGVLAYAVVTLTQSADEYTLACLADHILRSLASDYLTTLSQIGEKLGAETASEEDPDD